MEASIRLPDDRPQLCSAALGTRTGDVAWKETPSTPADAPAPVRTKISLSAVNAVEDAGRMRATTTASLGRSRTASAWWPAHRGRPARLGCVPGFSCRPMVLGTLGTERLPFDEAIAQTVFVGQAHSGQFDKELNKNTKTPKLLLAHVIPSYKIDHALTHPLALPVLVVGFAADRISVSLLHTAERQFQRNSLTGNGQGFIYAP